MDIIRTSPYCAMITIDKNNQPVARTMEPLEPDSNFVVWLGTNPRSRKVQEIKRNSTVCLYYGNTTANGYVTIRGKAQLINDEKEKTKHWKNSWGPFYKNKTTDFLLIKVVPDRLEVINYRLRVTGNPVNWEVPYIKF